MNATVALAGNPNSGKTTLFNTLTGAHQHVGNYPGVTVEKKAGLCCLNGFRFNIVDLPGTYSLTAYSLEEVVARNFLVSEKPAAVINILDASNLERNLYLTLQFMEMGLPICIALNMMDVAKHRGIRIDVAALSKALNVPIIPIIARNGQGKQELMEAVGRVVRQPIGPTPKVISYGDDIDGAMVEMTRQIQDQTFLTDCYQARWTALKYLEKDEEILKQGRCCNPALSEALERRAEQVGDHLRKTLNTFPEAMIADQRYGYIQSILRQGIIRFDDDRQRQFFSDRIDRIVVNRFFGPLIMLAVLLGLYHFTFSFSDIPVGLLERFFGWLGALADVYVPAGPLKSLVVAGVINGVGGVLGFVPLIMFMFFGIALLEDSGYLARVAFMLDRVFRIFGLHGSSVMAFIVSGGIAGGCAVPGVMATRTLKSRRERLATLLTVPFMNCGAKLPVFALLVGAFFHRQQALMMFVITLVAWLGALLVAKLLRVTVVRGPATPFVMELPPYRVPTLKGLAIHTWERTWQYAKKAGTVILGVSILLWAMMSFPVLPASQQQIFQAQRQALLQSAPRNAAGMPGSPAETVRRELARLDNQQAETALRYSLAGRLGIALEGVSRWAGFDWRTNIALIGGFAAKEVIVSTLGTAYALGRLSPEDQGQPLSQALAQSPAWSPLAALSVILFVMFYAPCFVSVICIVRESGHWKWGAFSMAFNTVLAFALATVVFQGGRLLGF
jgi:ferrous iron transport protein B